VNIFGPFVSPRFGRAIGINNVPSDICTYACQYCPGEQIAEKPSDRRTFYSPSALVKTLTEKIRVSLLTDKPLNYLVFMPDGEPTLDINLGQIIKLLAPIGIKIAVITNTSLIWQYGVQKDLALADWVCLKVDAVQENIWRMINSPHRSKYLLPILEGIQEFASYYPRRLVTETTLMQDLNDSEEHVAQIAYFLSLLKPSVAYLSILGSVSVPFHPPDEMMAKRAYQLFTERLTKVDYLSG